MALSTEPKAYCFGWFRSFAIRILRRWLCIEHDLLTPLLTSVALMRRMSSIYALAFWPIGDWVRLSD